MARKIRNVEIAKIRTQVWSSHQSSSSSVYSKLMVYTVSLIKLRCCFGYAFVQIDRLQLTRLP